MPTLRLKTSAPVPAYARGALARELTRITADILGKRSDLTVVMMEALSAEAWYVGGAVPEQSTAWLEISITAGTNTAAQKAAFIAAAFELLQKHLGQGQPLESASYVIVHELPADDWGYGGQPQAARQAARAASASREVVEGGKVALNR